MALQQEVDTSCVVLLIMLRTTIESMFDLKLKCGADLRSSQRQSIAVMDKLAENLYVNDLLNADDPYPSSQSLFKILRYC